MLYIYTVYSPRLGERRKRPRVLDMKRSLLERWVGSGWVTSEATALIDATVTAVAAVQVSVWRKRSGATHFWRADADFVWLGRCAMA